MQIPGYKIIDTLGEGGMARVYLAIQENFEREVALKVLDPHLSKDPSFTERFLHEARIVSRLVHPNIVTVYDMGVHRDYHYLSMEYVPGRDLKHRRFDLSLAQNIAVIKDVARALDYAGRKGCVHRDVKPDNIMLHADDNRAVLMDFGIARIVDQTSNMTQTGTTVGTPHYMSPEHARGAPVDSRSDLYSLGVVLFLVLSGYLPFDSDSAVAIGVKHISESIPKLPPHLAAFQPVIDRILAKRPEDRYQTGEAFIEALDEFSPEALEAMEREGERSLVQEADGESPTLHQPQAVIAQHDDEPAETFGEDYLAVDEEDRLEHLAEPEQEQRKGWLLGIILLSALGLGAFYYGQAPLRELWESRVASLMDDSGATSTYVGKAPGPAPEGASQSVEASPSDESSKAQAGDLGTERASTTEVTRAPEQGGPPETATGPATMPRVDPNRADPVANTADETAETPADGDGKPVIEEADREEEPADTAAVRQSEAPETPETADRESPIEELARLADEQAAEGDLDGALARVEEGARLYPDSERLALLRERLNESLAERRRQEQAEKAEQARLAEARQLASAVEAVEARLDAGQLAEAGERLREAREAFPGSPELLALEVEWQERRDAEQSPTIEQARVGDEPFSALDAASDSTSGGPPRQLTPGRVLYAGFAYRNFSATSAVIQAMLYDGSRQLQIAQVPVVVQGKGGQTFFRIERPVTGFAEGGYHLDLVSEGETLATVSFQVGNP